MWIYVSLQVCIYIYRYLANAGGGAGDKDDFAGDVLSEDGTKDAEAEFEEDPWR